MKRPHFSHSIRKVVLLEATAFTLLELMTVMAIIAVLAGLVLKGAGYAQNKAARDRAAAEIAAISVALESYKADNGEYPISDPTGAITGTPPQTLGSRKTNGTAPNTDAPTTYVSSSTVLFKSISNPPTSMKIYFESKPDIRSTGTAALSASTHFIDPFGNPYGYAVPNSKGDNTYNPTFDLWSTAGQSGSGATNQKQEKWITNW